MAASADGSWDGSIVESIVADSVSPSVDYSDDFDVSAAREPSVVAADDAMAVARAATPEDEDEYEYEYAFEEVSESDEGWDEVSVEEQPPRAVEVLASGSDSAALPRSPPGNEQDASAVYSDRFESFAFSDASSAAVPSESIGSLSGSVAAYSDDFDSEPTAAAPERDVQLRREPRVDSVLLASTLAALAELPADAPAQQTRPTALYARSRRTRGLVANAAAALRGKVAAVPLPTGASRMSILGAHIAIRRETVDDVRRHGKFCEWERTIAETKAAAERPPRRAFSREQLIAHATSQLRQKADAADFERRRHVHASFFENGQALVADVAASFARAAHPFADAAAPLPDACDAESHDSSGSAWSEPAYDPEIVPAVELALSRELVARANRTLDPAIQASLFTADAAAHAAATTEPPTRATLAASRDLRARIRAEFGDTTPAFLSPRSPADAEFGLAGSPRAWLEPGTFSLDEHRATLERSRTLRLQAAASVPVAG